MRTIATYIGLLGLALGHHLYAADKYIVLFKQSEVAISSLEHEAFQGLLQSSNTKSMGQLKEWLGGAVRAAAAKDLWLIRGAAVSLEAEMAKKLSREPWVSGIYPDRLRKFVRPTNPIKVANSLKELGEEAQNLWGLQRIGVQKIRAEFPQLTGKGVRVGIIDTGIQSNHPELIGKITGFRDFINNMGNPYDDHGHGTHVAGTISGIAVGIAPEASIVFAKSFTAVGAAQDSELLSAMQWMFDPDGQPATNDYPHVVSNSWGGDMEEGVMDAEFFAPYQVAMTTWIHGGIVPIFAAGNSGKSPNGFPGGLPEAIAVGALAPNDEIAEFSSRGPNLWKIGDLVVSLLKPDVSAPGVAITSAFPGNKYATWDGTSMATPHVTGAVALLLQGNPKLKFADVKALLLKSSERKADIHYGYGILDAYKLLKLGIGRQG